MPGAIYSWGIDAGGLLGLRRVLKRLAIDHVMDVRLGRAAPGTSRVDVARAVEKAGAIYSVLPAPVAFTDARGGSRILVLGADPVPWACPRHTAFLLPIAEDLARYRRLKHDWVTQIEVGHLVGTKILDPLQPEKKA
jgi:hypothetical protein